MGAGKKVAPTAKQRKNPTQAADNPLDWLQDAIGNVVAEVSIVESLATAATIIAGRAEDATTILRRVRDLAAQIQGTAFQAHSTVVEMRALILSGKPLRDGQGNKTRDR